MGQLLQQYKGDLSNYDTIKAEIENLLEELQNVNRTKVTDEFSEDVLKEIKNLRLLLMSISNYA